MKARKLSGRYAARAIAAAALLVAGRRAEAQQKSAGGHEIKVRLDLKMPRLGQNVKLEGWSTQQEHWKSLAWRADRNLPDPGDGAEVRITNLARGAYRLFVVLYDEKPADGRTGKLAAEFNGKALGTYETGGTDGRFVWEAAIPADAFAEAELQVLKLARTGYPVGIQEIWICGSRPSGIDDTTFERLGWDRYPKQRFVNPPVFRVTPLKQASSYRCVIAGHGAQKGISGIEVTSKTPELNLEGVWGQLAPNPEKLEYRASLEALDGQGRTLGKEDFSFTRAPSFGGVTLQPKCDYIESGRKAAAYIMAQAGRKGRIKNRYQALFDAMIIEFLVTFSDLDPGSNDSKSALATAAAIAKSAIAESTPGDWVYGNMPVSHSDKKASVLQVCRGPMLACAYLRLYERTRDQAVLDAALRVADTLKKTQLPDGRWYFRVEPQSGALIENYTSDQMEAILLLERQIRDHGRKEFEGPLSRAVQWMGDYPSRSFHWQQQWDDIPAGPPYSNLNSWDAGLWIQYLIGRAKPDNDHLRTAVELCRFVEDQFLEWGGCDNLVTPGVREQYRYWHIVDGHSGHFIRLCQALHEATGEGIYLEKAKALANALTHIQHPELGFYVTVDPAYQPGGDGKERAVVFDKKGTGWANCTAYTGKALIEFGQYLDGLKK